MRDRDILYREFYRRVYYRPVLLSGEHCFYCGQTICNCNQKKLIFQELIDKYSDEELIATIEIFNEWATVSDEKRLDLIQCYNVEYKGIGYKYHFPTIENIDYSIKPIPNSLIPSILKRFIKDYIQKNLFTYHYYYNWIHSKNPRQKAIGYIVMTECRNKIDFNNLFRNVIEDLDMIVYLVLKFNITLKTTDSQLFVETIEKIHNKGMPLEKYSFLFPNAPSNLNWKPKFVSDFISTNLQTNDTLILFSAISNICQKQYLESNESPFQDYKSLVISLFYLQIDGKMSNNESNKYLQNISNRYPDDFKEFIIQYLRDNISIDRGKEILVCIGIINFVYRQFKLNPSVVIDYSILENFILDILSHPSTLHDPTGITLFYLLDHIIDIDKHFLELSKLADTNSFSKYYIYSKLSNDFIKSALPSDLFKCFVEEVCDIYTINLYFRYNDCITSEDVCNLAEIFKVAQLKDVEGKKQHSRLYMYAADRMKEYTTIATEKSLIGPPELLLKFYQQIIYNYTDNDYEMLVYLKKNINEIFKCLEETKKTNYEPYYNPILESISYMFKNEDINNFIFSQPSEATRFIIDKYRSDKPFRVNWSLMEVLSRHSLSMLKPAILDQFKSYHDSGNIMDKMKILKRIGSLSDQKFNGVDILLYMHSQYPLVEMIFKRYHELGPPDDLEPILYMIAEISMSQKLNTFRFPNSGNNTFENLFISCFDSNDKFQPDLLYNGTSIYSSEDLDKLNNLLTSYPYVIKSPSFRKWYFSLSVHHKRKVIQNQATWKLEQIYQQQQHQQDLLVSSCDLMLPNIVYQRIIHCMYQDQTVHYQHKLNLAKVSKLFFQLAVKVNCKFYVERTSSYFLEIKNYKLINSDSEYSLLRLLPKCINFYNLTQMASKDFDRYLYDHLENLVIRSGEGFNHLMFPYRFLLTRDTQLKFISISLTKDMKKDQILGIIKRSPKLEIVTLTVYTMWSSFMDLIEQIILLKLSNIREIHIGSGASSDPNFLFFEPMIKKIEQMNIKIPRIFIMTPSAVLSSGCDSLYLRTSEREFSNNSSIPKALEYSCMKSLTSVVFTIEHMKDVLPLIEICKNYPNITKHTYRIMKLTYPKYSVDTNLVQQVFDQLNDLPHLSYLYLYYWIQIYTIPIYFGNDEHLWSQIDLKQFKKHYQESLFYK
ncbi:hypothetical protein DLAC_02180 [Tieghemostelium lacteum]|uniref:Uncharacterized protein n=1 Tax=Tieghemostelium lacteum TaxID=361077 RepID=A0A152A4A3_TIELA|nr:hypothetical protein DLAC_02180 [Tieghemostelium lacteum]|eukprot:KYR01083.1 hypothetical protein DLAC_02180 [Tieghemostelium lacteum]